jgi:tetratricopeptide (TPR) repeat protein
MKQLTIFVFAILISFTSFAQNDRYFSAMERGIGMIADERQAMEDWQAASNFFERIANAESEKWLPKYYHAYTNMMMAMTAYNEKTEFEPYLDKAQKSLDAAKKLAPNESEIYALQAYIYQGRIWSNMMVNGPKYSPMSHEACDKAIELNPNNPRPYYLKGSNTYFTPAFFGGGAENALPILEKANEKYMAYKAPSPLHPMWGQGSTEYFLNRAKKDLN